MTLTLVLMAWALAATMLASTLFATNRFLSRRLTEELAARVAWMAQARQEIGRDRERHEAEIGRITKMHEQMIESVLNMVSVGTPTPQEAIVTEAEPDAETRMQRGINDDMARVGGLRIQAEYEKLGQVVSIEECTEEARSMLSGLAPIHRFDGGHT